MICVINHKHEYYSTCRPSLSVQYPSYMLCYQLIISIALSKHNLNPIGVVTPQPTGVMKSLVFIFYLHIYATVCYFDNMSNERQCFFQQLWHQFNFCLHFLHSASLGNVELINYTFRTIQSQSFYQDQPKGDRESSLNGQVVLLDRRSLQTGGLY